MAPVVCVLLGALVSCQDSTTAPGLSPTAVPGRGSLADLTEMRVAASAAHGCAIRIDGVVECWGQNDQGQAPAIRRAATGFYNDIAAAANQSCARRTTGEVDCWGSDNSTHTSAPFPFLRIALGTAHGCGVASDGHIRCWGDNTDGQAPADTTDPDGSSFTRIAAGPSAAR